MFCIYFELKQYESTLRKDNHNSLLEYRDDLGDKGIYKFVLTPLGIYTYYVEYYYFI